MQKPNILIAIPTMGDIHSMLVSRLLTWSKRTDVADLNFYFTFRVSPHDRARNELSKFFMGNEKLTHILFIDADTIPPVDAIDKLLAHDLPFVTGLTPILRKSDVTGAYEVFDNCFMEPTRDEAGKVLQTNIVERDTGLQQIYRCGAACMLVRRDVFEKIEIPYFKFLYDAEGTKHTTSEDIYFCDRMREAGFDLFADTSVFCEHQKDLLL